MLSSYAILLIVHLLLFAYWLGADLGVFYSSFIVVDKDKPIADRKTAAGILVALDRLPRACLILMLPVSVSLASSMGQIAVSSGVLGGLWFLGAIWLVMLWRIETTHDATLTRIDAIIRLLVISGLVGFAIAGIIGQGPVASDWVALKMLLFATAITCGLMIRRVFAPFGPAFGALVTTGSTPEIEQTIDTSLKNARPFVIVIWACLIGAAAVSVIKPTL